MLLLVLNVHAQSPFTGASVMIGYGEGLETEELPSSGFEMVNIGTIEQFIFDGFSVTTEGTLDKVEIYAAIYREGNTPKDENWITFAATKISSNFWSLSNLSQDLVETVEGDGTYILEFYFKGIAGSDTYFYNNDGSDYKVKFTVSRTVEVATFDVDYTTETGTENYKPGDNPGLQFPVDDILAALNVESLSDLTVYGVDGDGNLYSDYQYGGYDGWKNSLGTPANWNSTSPMICVKLATDLSFIHLSSMNTSADALPLTLTAEYRLVKNEGIQDYVTVKVNLTVAPIPAVELTYDDLDIIGNQDVTMTSELGKSYEGEWTGDMPDIDGILETLGAASLDDVEIYAVQSDGSLTANYELGPTDGWRNDLGDWNGWGQSGTCFCVKYDAVANDIYYVGGYGEGDHLDTDHQEDVTYTAKYVFVYGENTNAEPTAVELRINLNYPGLATGISGISKEGMVDLKNAYDLSGRKVTVPVKGDVYIINGKKVLVK